VFAIFFSAIPVGAALGFILGGLVDVHFGWRAAFYVAGLPGLVLAALALTLHDPPRGGLDAAGHADAASGGHGPAPRGKSWRALYGPLLGLRRYRTTILGYAFATFAAGGLAYWFPAFLQRARGLSPSVATAGVGIVTAVTALVGTLLGGVVAERLLKRTKFAHLWFCGVSTLLAAPFVAVALIAQDPVLIFAAIVVGELFLFASTGPVNLAIVNAVRPDQRVAAVALSIFTIHMLGDVPSPPLIGWISDRTSLATAILLVPVAVVVAGLVWALEARRCEREERAIAASGKAA
jgi:sugar phosphate permease